MCRITNIVNAGDSYFCRLRSCRSSTLYVYTYAQLNEKRTINTGSRTIRGVAIRTSKITVSAKEKKSEKDRTRDKTRRYDEVGRIR